MTIESKYLYVLGAAIILAIAIIVYRVAKPTTQKPDSSLQTKLDERKNTFNAEAPESIKTTYSKGLQAVDESGMIVGAKQLGQIAPDFELTNASGKAVRLSKMLKKGPVVLTWYRGGWCPYCNLTLHALQEELPNIQMQGASLLALTPELPDQSMSTAEKNELQFEVLSDINNNVAREYGIVYKLTDEVAAIYEEKFGLSTYNGNDSNELPLAATYIINQKGEIIYAFLDTDYQKRAEPSEITAKLKTFRKQN
ncbi:MAG: peroxiredoxin-like family protein [Sedimentisphaeraceae bacterium JB056]